MLLLAYKKGSENAKYNNSMMNTTKKGKKKKKHKEQLELTCSLQRKNSPMTVLRSDCGINQILITGRKSYIFKCVLIVVQDLNDDDLIVVTRLKHSTLLICSACTVCAKVMAVSCLSVYLSVTKPAAMCIVYMSKLGHCRVPYGILNICNLRTYDPHLPQSLTSSQ